MSTDVPYSPFFFIVVLFLSFDLPDLIIKFQEWEIKIPEKSTDKRRSLIAPKHRISVKIQISSASEFVDFGIW